MCKFNCNKNCPNCEWYEPGGYYYESDCEGYRDEGCDIGQNPENCTKYEPTYVQSLLDEIEELKSELENFKKIDEDYLDMISRIYEKQFEYYEYLPVDIEEAYKAGYRRAKEK